jgi:hypothetical protein
MTSTPTPDFPEWNKLAEETLNLWQDYLTATANDPKQKAELAKLAEPLMGLGQSMFAEWTRMLQHTAHASSHQPAGSSPAATTAAAADPATAAYLAQLTGRVAELEQQLAELERNLAEPTTAAAKTAATPGAASRSAATAGRRRRAATDDHSTGD